MKFIIGLFVMLSLVGCQRDEPQYDSRPGYFNEVLINTTSGQSKRLVVEHVERNDVDRSQADVYYVEIENMPCMVLYLGSSKNGITCDWDYWIGKTNSEYEDEYKSTLPASMNTRKVSRAEMRATVER